MSGQCPVGSGSCGVRAPPVVLLLVGAPGSGKSTLGQRLVQHCPPGAWLHVNQDTVAGGKPGKRQQCEAAVRAALKRGVSCIIDRCHADREQRSHFCSLARTQGAALHCIVLQPPLKVGTPQGCPSR
ncbi:AAA domain-containing protein, partial [Haematococcus lacustris]